jgi:hypothetical protein
MIYYLHPYPQKLWLSWFQVQTIMMQSPKIEIPDEKPESFGFSVNGISITVGHDISKELLSKIMRAARDA